MATHSRIPLTQNVWNRQNQRNRKQANGCRELSRAEEMGAGGLGGKWGVTITGCHASFLEVMKIF